MRAKRGQAQVAVGRCRRWLLCFPVAALAVALPARSSGSEQPQEALLEFLGSEVMEETDGDWLDFLESLARTDADAAASADEPVLQGEVHEQE